MNQASLFAGILAPVLQVRHLGCGVETSSCNARSMAPAAGEWPGGPDFTVNPCTGCPSLAPHAIGSSFGRMWMGGGNLGAVGQEQAEAGAS